VVPLFETVKDLRGAGSVIRKLLSIDWYRQHIIKNHNGHQEVLFNYLFISFMLYSCCDVNSCSGIINFYAGYGWVF